jgi:hypothetical protein
MAGSFGYESEHYAISMKVGADRLFPAIDAAADAVVAATGTSCRDQILHGTERHAWHPVELVAQAMVPAGTGRRATRGAAPRRTLGGALRRAGHGGVRVVRVLSRRVG